MISQLILVEASLVFKIKETPAKLGLWWQQLSHSQIMYIKQRNVNQEELFSISLLP